MVGDVKAQNAHSKYAYSFKLHIDKMMRQSCWNVMLSLEKAWKINSVWHPFTICEHITKSQLTFTSVSC
jgi:hypothetical protein